jgi:hypothetical protein
MPQLDFFTFPHQYLVASFCFCGMYYFNLLFFFPKIKFFQINKIFSLKGLMANNIIILSYYYSYLIDLFSLENFIFRKFTKKGKKIQKKLLFKKMKVKKKKKVPYRFFSSKPLNNEINNSQNLFLFMSFSFLFLFFFFKNFLIFNAEKLMLIYFLIITSILFFFCNNFITTVIKEDLNKFLQIIYLIEENSNKIIFSLKNYLLKLQLNIVMSNLEFLLLKNLEVKLLRKIK